MQGQQQQGPQPVQIPVLVPVPQGTQVGSSTQVPKDLIDLVDHLFKEGTGHHQAQGPIEQDQGQDLSQVKTTDQTQ